MHKATLSFFVAILFLAMTREASAQQLPAAAEFAGNAGSAPATENSPRPANSSRGNDQAVPDAAIGWRVEFAGGYSYVHANTFPAGSGFGLSGGGGSLAVNLNRWVAAVADIEAVHQGNVAGSKLDLTLVTYMFGPRVSLCRNHRFTPFLQGLIGGSHASGTLYAPPAGSGFTGLGASSAVALSFGGGLDLRLQKHVAIRLAQLEYVMTNHPNGDDFRQDNLRVLTGIVFRF